MKKRDRDRLAVRANRLERGTFLHPHRPPGKKNERTPDRPPHPANLAICRPRTCATLACCDVGLVRPLIPTAFVANLFRSARGSRPCRSADRGSPGDAPTVGDCGRRGRAGQETLPEPAWRRQPQVTAMGQSDPLPRTPHGNGEFVVRGLVSTPGAPEESGTNAPFWPGACATRLQHAAPSGSWLQGPGVNVRWDCGDEAVEDVLRDE